MKATTLFATVLLAAGLAQNTLADSDSGFYLGGSLGNAKIAFEDADGGVNDTKTGYKVFGGYNFDLVPMVDLGIETSYVDLGTMNGNIMGESFAFSNSAWQAHLVGGIDVGPVGLFAKAGVSQWETKLSSDVFSGSTTGSDPAYGIGAKFQAGPIQLRAEFERINLDDADLDFYSLGAAFTF